MATVYAPITPTARILASAQSSEGYPPLALSACSSQLSLEPRLYERCATEQGTRDSLVIFCVGSGAREIARLLKCNPDSPNWFPTPPRFPI